MCFSVCVWFIKIQSFYLFIFFAYFFFQFFMNLLFKIYMKRHDRHNKTLWTTDFFNSVFCLVSCSSKDQVPCFILNKVVPHSNLTHLLLRDKKQMLKKTHLGQVFSNLSQALRQRDFFSSFSLITSCRKYNLWGNPLLIHTLCRIKVN